MRVGLIARADRTGLGIQTWGFYRNMNVDETLIVDLSHCSGQPPDLSLYAGDPNVEVWKALHYPDPRPKPEPTLDRFLDRVDVVFTCETPYNPWLFEQARRKGVRTILQPNYEFLEILLHPSLPQPDVYALPSLWHYEEIIGAVGAKAKVCLLPVPVDRDLLPCRARTQLRTILHTAGTPAMEDRNGTLLLIEAMGMVRSPVTCRIRTQKTLPHRGLPGNVLIDGTRIQHYWELYGDEDLFVMPRKFGGLCLPVQEAMSVGMPTLMSDVAPQNGFLAEQLLVPARPVKQVMTRAMIDINEVNPADLAARIDWLYDHPDVFADLSQQADTWAQGHSWERQRTAYEAILEGSWP